MNGKVLQMMRAAELQDFFISLLQSYKSKTYIKMKKAVSLLFFSVFISIGLAGYTYWENSKAVTSGEFSVFRKEFIAKIDSINFRLDSIEKKITKIEFNTQEIKSDTDTIKAGQYLIYQKLTTESKETFVEKIIRLLN